MRNNGRLVLFPFMAVAALITSCQGNTDAQGPGRKSEKDGNSTLSKPLPKASLENTPPAVTSFLDYEVKVGGSDVVAYVYAIVEGRGCDSAKYSAEKLAISIPIKGTLSKDGEYTLCVKAHDANGRVQEVATSQLWKIDRTVPSVSLSNPPRDFNTTDVISASVIGMNAVEYAWVKKIGKLSADECQGQEYSEYRPIADEISALMTADGDYTLCLIGKSETGVVSLPAAYTWLQDRNAPGVVVNDLPKIWNANPFDVTLIPQNRAQSAEIWVANGAVCGTKPPNLNVRLFEESGSITYTITAEDLKQDDCPATGCSSGLKTRRLCVETSKQGVSESRKNLNSEELKVDLSNPLMTLVIKDSTKINVTDRCSINRTASVPGNSTKCPTTSTSLFVDISALNQVESANNLMYRTQFVAEGAACPQDGNNWSAWSDSKSKVFPLLNQKVTSLPADPGKYKLCAQVQHSLKTLNAIGQIVWLDRVSSNIQAAISTTSKKLSAQVNASYRSKLLPGAEKCDAADIVSASASPKLATTIISDSLGTVQNKFFKLCLMADTQVVPTELVFFIDNTMPSLLVTPPALFSNLSKVKIEFAAAVSGPQYNAGVDAVKFALVNFDESANPKKCLAAPVLANFKPLDAAGKGFYDVDLVDAEKNTTVTKCLYARDTAGNVGPAQQVKWTYDTTAPATPTVTGGLPAADGRDARTKLVDLSISGTDIVTSRALIVEGSTCPSLPATNYVEGPTIGSIDLPNLNNSLKSLCAYGIDRAGNSSTFQLKWTFDNTPPMLTLSGTPSADQNLRVGDTATVNVTATITGNEQAYLAISLFEEAAAPNLTTYCTDKMKTATFGTVLMSALQTGNRMIAAPATSVFKIVCGAAKDAQGNMGVVGELWKVTRQQ